MSVYMCYISVFSYIDDLCYMCFPIYKYYIHSFSLFFPRCLIYSYIRLFSFQFLPIQCFPYSKNNTFLSIHYFLNKVYRNALFLLYFAPDYREYCPFSLYRAFLYSYIRLLLFFILPGLQCFSYIYIQEILPFHIYIGIRDIPLFFCILPRFHI